MYLDFKCDNVVADIVHRGLLIGHLLCITNHILFCFMHITFRHCIRRLLTCFNRRVLDGMRFTVQLRFRTPDKIALFILRFEHGGFTVG